MYEASFDLNASPFASAPQTNFYVPSEGMESARQKLSRCLHRAEGAGLLIGPPGAGKTLLLNLLAEEFRGEFEVATLHAGRLSSRRALLQAILYELDLPYRQLREGELRLSLIEHLTRGDECGQGLVLLVDEAHSLPLRLLEEIRLITNLSRDGQSRVRVVLAAGAQLEERFANSRLELFNQRIAARCYLTQLNSEETALYIEGRIKVAGSVAGRLFDGEAARAIYHATDGTPRLINQLCDHCLLLIFSAGHKTVGKTVVEEAWADLQQLPTPWENQPNADQSSTSSGDIIEYGTLDDMAPIEEAQSSEAFEEKSEEEPTNANFDQPAEGVAESDFQPAGVIGPEVELLFEGELNPFTEAYEEEEIVVDRCAKLQAELGRMGTDWVDSSSWDVATEVASPGSVEIDISNLVPSVDQAIDYSMSQVEFVSESIDTAEPLDTVEPECSVHDRLKELIELASARDVPPTLPIDGNVQGGGTETGLTAAGKGGSASNQRPNGKRRPIEPVLPVHRYEYNHLFARLRHG